MANVREFSDSSRIRAEAREWLIRLDSEIPAGSDELDALREWLNRSPAHRRELIRISRFWDSANVLTELAIPLNKPGTSSGRPLPGKRLAALTRYPRGAVAAGLVLVVCVLIYAGMPGPSGPREREIHASAIGQIRTVVLQDGTAVDLNTESLIEVDYSGEARRIRLLQGESHFQVKSDPDRPFEVHAEGRMVRAVGTAFSVYLHDDDVMVTVEEGEVELATVRDEGTGGTGTMAPSSLEVVAALKHRQSATFGALERRGSTEVVTLSEEELDRQFSWRRGVLSFAGEPLSEVVDRINRYTPKTIEIVDPELNAIPIGGRFRVAEIEEVFDVLQTSFGIRISRVGDHHILLRAE